MKRREQSQTEQLRQALAEREAQLQEARARLAAVEGSTSLQVGRALTAAAKKPSRSLVRLPRDLYRLWRRSGTTHHTERRRGGVEPVRSFDADRQEARLLTGVPGSSQDMLVVATVVGTSIAEAIGPYVHPVPLRPHDAQIVMDGLDVDLVLVSSSAAAPGSPWAHVGDPAVVDRTRALHWVLQSAAARSIPTVLIEDAPAAPALRTLGFDKVHRGDAGVPLHVFNPVAAHLTPGPEAVFVRGHRDEPVPEVLRELGAGVVDADSSDLADALRAANVAVVPAFPSEDTRLRRRAWACGTHIVTHAAVPNPAEPAEEGLAVTVPRLRAEEPTAAEQRGMLRQVFLKEATPVRLAEILEGLSFPPGTSGARLPLRGRSVAVLADPVGESDAELLADDLLASLLKPTEVVVPGPASRLPGVQRLRAHGITVRTTRFTAPDTPEELTRDTSGVHVGGLGPERWAVLAERATAPWSLPWSAPMGRRRLADLVCAVECSDADAVGIAVPSSEEEGWGSELPSPGSGTRGFFDRPSTGGQQYVFVSEIVPELARTELLRRGWDPKQWNRRGARLLALGSDHGRGTDSDIEDTAYNAADAPTGAVG